MVSRQQHPARRLAGLVVRRTVVFGASLLFTIVAVFLMGDLLGGMPMRGWNGVVLALFAVLFALLSFGGCQAFAGFVLRRFRRRPGAGVAGDPAAPLAATAVVMPVYNEDPTRVFAAVRTMYRSLERAGRLESFEFFVLSDTTDADVWVEEEVAWEDACQDLGARGRLFYRRRRNNVNKKAGNLADFCRRWGQRYRYMIVLDADSVLAGATFVRLVQMMEANPQVGLMQTVPTLVRAESLFARILQFGVRLYGPVFVSGLGYWQQGSANYWGHNAILRVQPFMQHCALPRLPGREPFGGKILSHDFVEAALLQRAGWEVWMVPELGGSYEEGPPTLIDAARRDRRWCQGNIQHAWLLFARGLNPFSRLHFSLGILAYGASVLWLLFLVLGSLLGVGFHRTGLTLVPTPGFVESLGISHQMQSTLLLGMTLVLLFGPKLVAVLDLVLRRGALAQYGGARRVLPGVACETLFSVVLAPILMLFHSRFVASSLLGEGTRWLAQRRTSEGTRWREALAAHGGQTFTGLVWTVVLVMFAPRLVGWMFPVLGGLLLAIPFSVLTSRASIGRRARALGLFCTPEELEPPPELRELEEELAARAGMGAGGLRGLVRAVVEPRANALHVALLRAPRRQAPAIRRYFEELRERLLIRGPEGMAAAQRMAVLSDPESMAWLHREVWRGERSDLAPRWLRAIRARPAPVGHLV